jgi:ferredoxin
MKHLGWSGHLADHPTSMPGGRYICGMRIVVDFDLCESNALCMAAAPEVFEVRDDDFLYVLQEEPPEELRDKVQAAVRACPKAAISVID